ncbi:peptidase M6 [Thermotomaculum hydrothermale]|uniref:Peptidase M6 n=1 Tax=Thermotomaculum hydrothermale TaxID=981385 RepID=A0A7R6PT47_9BACT|nr:M6 family metalloprotease domain-containing protein [Thermotomaculum hydrothermale]BBB32142.1 peptidase M6 [Thermotomaculum hydrothermale]
MRLKKVFSLFLATILFIPSLWALEPPTREMIQKYKKDGTLAERIQRAKSYGNYKMPEGAGAYLHYKLLKAVYKAKGETDKLKNLKTPPLGWRNMPTTGDVNVLIICVEFQDYPHYTDIDTVRNKVFGNGNPDEYPYESLHNYYNRASYGKLNLQGDVLGWYQAPYNRDQIQKNNTGRENFIKEVFQYYDEQGVDFSKYDNDGDGKIDYFAIIWAGPHEGWSDFWWGYMTTFQDTDFKVDGVSLGGYSWQWENYYYPDPYDPNATDIEYTPHVLIHETGHALGLPDYYDYDDSVGPKGGVGGLDMMDHNWGDHNCFSKYVLDWIEPTIIVEGDQEITLNPSEENPDVVLVMPNYSENSPFGEFYMIQYRKRIENDVTYPNDGLLIWHVDARLNQYGYDYLYDNSYTEHKLLRLMEADGLEQIEQNMSADAGDYYTQGDIFSPTSSPNSNAYNGDRTGITVSEIGEAKDTIKFTLAIKGNVSYLAHYDIRNGLWESRLTLGCGGEIGEKVQLAVYDNNGSYYGTKEFVLPSMGGISKMVPDIFDFSIPDQGFIEIESKTENVKGIITFKYIPTGGETSLPLKYQTSKLLIFPLIEHIDRKSTGIAIINTSDRTNTVTFELYDYYGFKKATRTVELSGKQKYVDMLENLFGSSLQPRGFLKVSAERDITGFALTFTEGNTNIIAIPSNEVTTQ